MKFLIGAVILISGLVKLIGVNQSLWLDEAISASVAKSYSLFDIPTQFSVSDFHPPIYYMFLKLWTNIFGFSELSLRVPSIIFSLITIYLVYLITKKISNKKTALWAAVFTGFNPLLIYYAQEVRMYSLITMLLAVVLYYFVKLENKISTIDIIMFNIFGGLSFATFYGSVFFIAALNLFWLIKKKFKLFFMANIGLLIVMLALSPLLIRQVATSKQLLIEVKNWSSVLGKVDFKNLVLIPIKFTSGRISYSPKIIYFGVASIWALFVALGVINGAIKKPKFLGILIFSLIFGLIFSFFSPLMQYFRFIYLIPIMSILLAMGLSKERTKLIFGIVFIGFASLYLFNENMYREDWKGMAKSLKENETVYIIGSVSAPLQYYQSGVKFKDIKTVIPTESLITVVPYVEEIHGFDHNQVLKKLGYERIEEQNFRQLKLERWFKN